MEQINRVVSSAIFAMLAASAFSQTPVKLSFEVASIKPNMSAPAGVFVDATKGRFLATNASTILLLRYAFEPDLPEHALRRGDFVFQHIRPADYWRLRLDKDRSFRRGCKASR
jgi:hypothetical protein